MSEYNPPLMFNRGFLEEKDNLLKLAEVLLGIACAVLNSYCFPNSLYLYCTYLINSFPQIFSIICINVFFVVLTALLAFCNLIGVTDAYYKWNFPLLEKYLLTLAASLYFVGSIIQIISLATSQFVVPWLLPVIFTIITFVVYVFDAQRRWKTEQKY